MAQNCEMCGVAFDAKGTKRFCSSVCANRFNGQARMIRCTCKFCDQDFAPKVRTRITYCSRECAFADKRRQSEQKKVERQQLLGERQQGRCICCGVSLDHSRDGYCSDDCRRARAREKAQVYAASKKPIIVRQCKECGAEFAPEYGNARRTFCSQGCCDRQGSRISKATRRAHKITNGPYDIIDPKAVCRRDGWRCYLCGKGTPRELWGSVDHDDAPTMDHVVPLARGGTHSWDNVRCCCRRCNYTKSDNLIPQSIAAYHPIQMGLFDAGTTA